MSCFVCDKENSKYTCPICLVPYCSVDCCKTHKSTPCSPPKVEIEEKTVESKSSSTYRYPTEDTIPIEILQKLDSSEGLKGRLNNPYLREMLKELVQCDNPGSMMEKCMQEPIFTEFVDECLKVVLPEEKTNIL